MKFINLVGFDLDSDIEPWESVDDDWEDDLKKVGTIIIDKSILETYPDLEEGDEINVEDRIDLKIGSFSEGGLLMGTPFAWCSLETARSIYPYFGNYSTALGLKFDDGYDIDDFKEDIKHIDDISVYTTQEIFDNTDDFIMNKIGVGMIIFLMAGMGFLVGIIIISITTYQSVLEKIPLFGTIKAIGAEKKFINKMMFGQVFIYMTVSFIIGSLMAMNMGSSTGMDITVNPTFSLWLYLILLGTSFLCAFVSVRQVHKIDPGIVFRR